MMYKNLLRPFSYLCIKHKLKWRVDWLYPFIFSTISFVIILLMKLLGPVSLYADNGLVGKILNFVQILPGFYIAALAAVATFNKPDMDKTMPAPVPQLKIFYQGKKVSIELTRRRFLCLMFAFLSAESLLLIVLSIFSQSFYLSLKNASPEQFQSLASYTFIWFYLVIFWQMIIATFWGLFYLGDRVHQPDAY